jgi:hypothetical protein
VHPTVEKITGTKNENLKSTKTPTAIPGHPKGAHFARALSPAVLERTFFAD